MPKVNYTRTEVVALTPRWDLVRDVLSGEEQIKKKGVKYLPKPNATDTSEENSTRYDQYKLRAVFYGVTGRTLKGLSGQVFARDPVLALPPLMDVVKDDVDGAGVSLDQQARKALSHILAYGRAGLLTDYPKTDKPATKADLEQGNIRPTITIYDPWDVINWRTVTIGSKKLLSLVVLSEKEVCDDDGFEAEFDEYYRVLRLVNGVYVSEIWYFDDTINDFVLESTATPLKGDGSTWEYIPFTFIGAENNDPQPDLPPLYDLAVINLAHYRNSADYEESCYIVGQPTPYFAGLTEGWVKDVLNGRIPLGARAAVLLPEGGSAGLLQAAENTMPKEAMEAKERQMVALGARLVEQSTVQRTAMEAGMEEASTSSLLATCAKNVSHAYTCALAWAGEFLGIKNAEESEGDAISYVLNSEFDLSKLDPTAIAQIIAAWQANAIAKEEMRDNLRRGGIAYLDDEAFQAAVDAAGIDLGMPAGSPASTQQQQLELEKQKAADAAKAKAAAGKGK